MTTTAPTSRITLTPRGAVLAGIAEAWRPYRSWVALLLRADRERRTRQIGG